MLTHILGTKIFNMIRLGVLLLLITTLFQNCQLASEYDKMVARELASGERHDELFLDISLGMSSQDFYQHCWEMNKQQVIKQGDGNTSVAYDLSDQLRHPGKMNFYPTFHNDKIVEMPVQYNYHAFTWDEKYSLDTLLADVVQLIEEEYGALTLFEHPKSGEDVFVRVDGNRRIRVFKNPVQNKVQAVFTDLTGFTSWTYR